MTGGTCIVTIAHTYPFTNDRIVYPPSDGLTAQKSLFIHITHFLPRLKILQAELVVMQEKLKDTKEEAASYETEMRTMQKENTTLKMEVKVQILSVPHLLSSISVTHC